MRTVFKIVTTDDDYRDTQIEIVENDEPRLVYLWVGPEDGKRGEIGSIGGRATLRSLANSILTAIGDKS